MPPNDIDLSDPQMPPRGQQRKAQAATYAFPVRIGEAELAAMMVCLASSSTTTTRKFRLVDKVIASAVPESGRSRGQLGLYGENSGIPAHLKFPEGYIVGTDEADTLMLHIGQTVTADSLHASGGEGNVDVWHPAAEGNCIRA